MYEGEESNFDAAPPEESSNRTFLIAAAILGGIVLLSVACLAAYALFVIPRQQQAAQAAQEQQNIRATQDAAINQALTATFEAGIVPTTTFTPPPTATQVVAQVIATETPAAPSPDPATATVAAALTQAAIAQLTVVPTSTALPGTGIADEYGLPGLAVMAMAFVIVIFLARRLRSAPSVNK